MSNNGRPRNRGFGPKRLVTKAEKHNAAMRATNQEMTRVVDNANGKSSADEEIPTMAVGQIWLLKRKPTLLVDGESEINCHLHHPHKVVIVSCEAKDGILHDSKFIRVVKVLPLIPVTELSGDDELTLLADQLEKPFKSEYAMQRWNPQIVLFHNFESQIGKVKQKSTLFKMVCQLFDFPSREQLRIKDLMTRESSFTLSASDQRRVKCYRSMKYIRHPYHTLDQMNERSFLQKMVKSSRI